ncbi:TonB-dependent receptor domain-containing protein [Roseomonas sp. 18066]|uniref:TonB-dependent receptor domain-containing protein n=1 Tax=Roseomonas sp. 18066 TaxID=2681412 RepID=UPI00135A9DA1|nr:TonB-dependent receptor [Roseomonas sp. 18066]
MRTTLHQLMASSAMAAALAAAAPAFAQTAAVPIPQVDVPAEAGEAASNSIGRERLTTEGANRIGDVLRTMPGVFTRENAQQPGVAVNIRGFEGQGRVTTMIDGVRQNFRFTGHEAGGFTYVDPNLLAGIEVMRGAVVGTGGGGLAGSVNLRTLDVDDVLLPGRQVGVLSRLGWGSNGVDFQEMIAGAAKVGPVGIVGAISSRSSRNYHDGSDASVSGTGQDLMSGLVKGRVDLGGGHSLGLGFVAYDNDFFANSYRQTINNKTMTANYRYSAGNPLVDLRVNGSYNDLTMKYTGGTGSAVGRVIEDQGAGFDVSNTSRFSLGPINVVSTNGVEYFHDDVSSTNGGVNPGSGSASQWGVFSNTTFSHGIFELTPGLRYNHYSLEGSGYTSTRFGAYDVDISKGSVDPRITLAANVTPWLQPYVTWSRSMRAPTLQETMLGGSHPGSTSASYIPNPNLSPETQQGWEFGVNIQKRGLLRETDTLRARAAYFVMDVDDYIAARYVTAQRVFQNTNIEGTTKQRGFEAEVSYDARIVFGSLGYTHIDSDLPSQMPGIGASQYLPDDVVSASLGARFLDERLTVGARYDYVSGGLVSGFNSSFTGPAVTDRQDGYHLVGLFASAKVTENVELNARVSNLLDEKYVPFLSTTGNGQGRTFYLGTQLRF